MYANVLECVPLETLAWEGWLGIYKHGDWRNTMRIVERRDMISIIMLTYNRETLVSRAIDSILAQTYQDFEFIIVDNGSTDRSGQVADEYAARDKRIKVKHRGRGSIGSGRNAGLDIVKGKYVAFIDDDDWVEPDFLEFLLKLAQDNDADMAICGATDKAFDEKKVMTPEEALIELMWRKKYNAGFPTKLIHADLFYNLRFQEDESFDDIGLMYKLLAQANKVAYHGLPKYHILRHPGNHSSWTTDHRQITPEILGEYLAVYRRRTEWLSNRFPDRAAAFQYFEWSFMISMVEKIDRLHLQCCEPIKADMAAELQKHRDDFLNAPEILDFEKDWVIQYIPV